MGHIRQSLGVGDDMNNLTRKQLIERLEWLEKKIEENKMNDEILWFISNQYQSKFLKEKK